jgi:hypothetical protein
MTRKMVVLATVAAFGFSAAFAGAGDAFACDSAAKTASAKTASSTKVASSSCTKDASQASAVTASASCCAKGAKTTTAGNVHKAMIKSAMVAPGASPAINTAAFAANVQGTTVSADCCKSSAAAATVASGTVACDKGAAVHTAGAGKSCGSAVETAGAEGCSKSTKTAAAAVDAVPYRENKRLVLTGSYECGHCGLGATAECSPMFKTADGKVYPLLDSERVSNLRDANADKNVEISTVVKKVDGVKYLDVKSYKTL